MEKTYYKVTTEAVIELLTSKVVTKEFLSSKVGTKPVANSDYYVIEIDGELLGRMISTYKEGQLPLVSGLLLDIIHPRISMDIMLLLQSLQKEGLPKFIDDIFTVANLREFDLEKWNDIQVRIEQYLKVIKENQTSKIINGPGTNLAKGRFSSELRPEASRKALSELLKLQYREIEKLQKLSDSILYNHYGIKKILQHLGLTSSDKFSTNIRGYNNYGMGYELDRLNPNLIYFHSVNNSLRAEVKKLLEVNGFVITKEQANYFAIAPFYDFAGK